jgi:hypothetical protein
MAIDIAFRRRAVGELTNQIGVYILCDLDQVPVYVGRSLDGIRKRVQRHLTSARSDIIANRQIDVWEIAWVWAYPVEQKAQIPPLEAVLYHQFSASHVLMNGTIPPKPPEPWIIPDPVQVVQVMADSEIIEKRDPALRLPRQSDRYSEIVGHFLAVKNSKQIARAMHAHFERLRKYHGIMLGLAVEVDDSDGD